VAIKIEKRGTKNQQIFSEAKILRYLTNSDVTTDFGVPHSYFYGTEGDYNVLIMDLYGESLMDLFEANGCKFDLKTTLMIGYQMIERIEYVHGKHYLHRDVKPENFVMGNGKKAHRLYLIDFGIAKKYLTEKG
jgi:casein kinase 1